MKPILHDNCAICDALMLEPAAIDNAVVGKTGLVTARIAPSHLGEIRIPVRGGTEDYLAVAAHADDAFDVNAAVVVVGFHPPRTVVVRSVSRDQ